MDEDKKKQSNIVVLVDYENVQREAESRDLTVNLKL